jgi:hypothetical protein
MRCEDGHNTTIGHNITIGNALIQGASRDSDEHILALETQAKPKTPVGEGPSHALHNFSLLSYLS